MAWYTRTFEGNHGRHAGLYVGISVEPRWAHVAVADVQTSAVRSWVQDMVTAGAGPATVEDALSVLRQVLGPRQVLA